MKEIMQKPIWKTTLKLWMNLTIKSAVRMAFSKRIVLTQLPLIMRLRCPMIRQNQPETVPC